MGVKEYDAPEIRRIIEKTANKLAIFQDFYFEPLQNKNIDYILQIEMFHYDSMKFRSCTTHHYLLNAKLYDKNNKLIKKYTYADSIDTWVSILVIPLAANTASDAKEDVLENMFNALFRDLVKDNTMFTPFLF